MKKKISLKNLREGQNACCDPNTGYCTPSTNSRRDFIKAAALTASTIVLPQLPVFAGPFDFDEIDHLIPEDKKLSSEWLKSLFERGAPEVFKDEELKHIGMPVGGIGCGQLYLGGDGRLWLWHIFKTVYSREKDHGQKLSAMTLGGHYAYPEKVFGRETRPVEQGAAIRITSGNQQYTRRLNSEGFRDITFRGEYPIGKVAYKDVKLPVEVNLEAFSPFIPGQLDKSALPTTIMAYKVKNISEQSVEVELAGWLENAVCPYADSSRDGIRRNTIIQGDDRLTVFSSAEALESTQSGKLKDDIVFEDFEGETYKSWSSKGIAFGKEPVRSGTKDFPEKEMLGDYYVSSYNVRTLDGIPNISEYPWGKITPADALTGSLTSKTFTITHNYITFLIAGGYHPNDTVLNLIVDDQVVRSQTGQHNGKMITEFFDVIDFAGKKAKLQIVDNHQGIWGSIAVDHIVFTDKRPTDIKLEELEGYGSMALTLYQATGESKAILGLDGTTNADQTLDALTNLKPGTSNTKTMDQKQIGALGEKFSLQPGEEKEVTFILSWFFPYLNEQETQSGQLLQLNDIKFLNKHYNNWFNSANQVADYVCRQFDELAGSTRLWNKTYYDSTLPYWLLDRSFIPIDCLASNTFLWFDNGRIWAWEGVECCPGTCEHVWQYAQGMARIFPEAERTLREVTDLGISFGDDGRFGHRDETAGQHGFDVAHDGHCGTIMRIYREHKTSSDYTFLKRNYQKIKKSVQFIINEDKDRDGILEGRQQNTLDAAWFGPMGWISSLYLGSLACGKEMALEVGDNDFAQVCNELLEKGRKNIVDNLFNGEYFIHKPDPNYPEAINTNDGCHIDQVLGQSFGWQVGLSERVIPEEACVSALESIWKYNFAPDAYLYQDQNKPIKGARIYATTGEAGTIMCTWPKGGADKAVPGMEKRPEKSERWSGPGGYFDETMNGFEYQVAMHMVSEGMVEKGLAITKAVHDRYSAIKRNPYNEIECSDHYSRSMASYGVLLSVSGFDYHGPKGRLSFGPKVDQDNFNTPFTVAEGWGTFIQQTSNEEQRNKIELKYGELRLSEFSVLLSEGATPLSTILKVNGKEVSANGSTDSNGNYIWKTELLLKAGDVMEATVRF
ncbi:MAG: GH116 family glycosyl-hydrolase [Bacteroidetes bacterium]|nr:GH116 family glycosyl-hydrolase [Bacteroidota bacterium]MDA1120336.1 GH116 family glycosyl-hydrolase [Bacteroidota bacterium]